MKIVYLSTLVFLALASNCSAQRLPYDGSPLYPDHRQQAQCVPAGASCDSSYSTCCSGRCCDTSTLGYICASSC
ncbi:hypothetical protein BDV33DRAFT_186219 [Aspergillus novoparasiticus]|uniref:Uncharacterized protein n=1 Tax=Aspergillus novoparasiticus TaxID=986946 RepID=A0A5N6E5W0_9EURO|nr:hypothetical protein BDV33DRAFT_186219 [Aspergillus novoparasiticus]